MDPDDPEYNTSVIVDTPVPVEQTDDEEDEEEDDLPLSALTIATTKSPPSTSIQQPAPSTSAASRLRWRRKRHFSPENPEISQPTVSLVDTSEFSYLQYFEQYIDDAILELIVEKSNQTYLFKKGHPLKLSLKELKVFIGISMVMSCLQYPHIRMYWENRWRVPVISDNMCRTRFFTLRTSLKVVFDENVAENERKTDRLWKLRPLIDRIRNGCLRQSRDKYVCVDEMMVPFSGVCTLKQYVPNKPNPVGLKVFVLANPNGIVLDFIFYQGETTFPELTASGFSLGESSVLKLTESLTPGHCIYYDRYFTTEKLVTELLSRGFLSTGTINNLRVPKDARLKSDKEMRKEGRGACDMLVRQDEKVCILKWLDRKSVTMMSSVHGIEPMDTCSRYNKKEKTRIQVKRPAIVKEYNGNMGGVDLADRMMSYCPMRARTKKWTIRTILHLLDVSVANSWLQLRQDQWCHGVPRKKIPQMRKYKLSLGEMLIYSNEEKSLELHDDPENENGLQESQTKKRSCPTPMPCDSKRRAGVDHMPEIADIKEWKKCRKPGCKGKTRTSCQNCKVFLCLVLNRNCFADFHQEK